MAERYTVELRVSVGVEGEDKEDALFIGKAFAILLRRYVMRDAGIDWAEAEVADVYETGAFKDPVKSRPPKSLKDLVAAARSRESSRKDSQ